MDNEVTITFTFHAMGDDPQEVLARCMAYFDPSEPSTVAPQELKIEISPR